MDCSIAMCRLAVYGSPVKPQTATGMRYRQQMGTKAPKREVPPSKFRGVLADNLEALMTSGSPLSSSPKLEQKSGVAIATINRIRRKESGATIDSLDAIAAAYDLEPWQLLIRNMDPKNPPVVAGVSEQEKALYERLQSSAREIVALTPAHVPTCANYAVGEPSNTSYKAPMVENNDGAPGLAPKLRKVTHKAAKRHKGHA